MKSQNQSALPLIKEVFKGIGDLGGEIVELAKSGELSKEEISLYKKELGEMIEMMQSLKEGY